MKDFLGWNDALARYFFRPENAGRTVFLYVTHEVIGEIGQGETVKDFVAAMKSGPDWRTRSGLCQMALQGMRDWRRRGLTYPPYVGYLALFVLALDVPGLHPNAYYARLRTLLGEEAVNGQYPSFDKMLEVWDDLEQWANEDIAGTLGIVRTDFAGAWMHVGVPAAQAILKGDERERLHEIFAEEGLDPEYPPTNGELRSIVLRNADGRLLPRTIRALEDGGGDYSAVLLERIAAELEAWDGSAPDVDNPAGSSRGQAFLCLRIDDIAQKISAELRCRFGAQVPGTLVLRLHGQEFACGEAGAFSKALVTNGKIFDAAALEWTRAATFRADARDVVVRFPGCDHRIFISGKERGIPGWVETARIDPTRSFFVAAAPTLADRIAAWGARCATGFRERRLIGGPDGWRYFSADGAFNEDGIGSVASRLAFERQARRIQLAGGIHIPGKTSYFRFAPPKVRLDGPTVDPLEMNGISVIREEDGSFGVPEEQLAERLVTVVCGALKRRIYFEDGLAEVEWEDRTYTREGVVVPGAGVRENGVTVPDMTDPFTPVLPMITNGRRVDMVGQSTGELAPYTPGTPLPFAPVWLLIHHGRDEIRAIYVASELLLPSQKKADKKATRAWKDVLWYQRMRIDAPTFKPLRALWTVYRNAAQHA